MLDSFANGLITTINGLITLIGGLVSLPVLLVGLCAVSLLWLAACEIEDLDQRGIKPTVRRN